MVSCPKNSWFTVHRHNQIRDLLVDLIKATASGSLSIHIEPTYHESTGGYKKADIEIRNEDRLLVIDVQVINPASQRYRQPGRIPDRDHACKIAERDKRNLYKYVDSPELIRSKCLIPFVMDATGRLGPTAKAFIEQFTSHHTFARSYFLNCLAATTAVYNTRAYTYARSKATFRRRTEAAMDLTPVPSERAYDDD